MIGCRLGAYWLGVVKLNWSKHYGQLEQKNKAENQSELKVKTEGRDHVSNQVTVGVSLAVNRLREWRDVSRPITGRSATFVFHLTLPSFLFSFNSTFRSNSNLHEPIARDTQPLTDDAIFVSSQVTTIKSQTFLILSPRERDNCLIRYLQIRPLWILPEKNRYNFQLCH